MSRGRPFEKGNKYGRGRPPGSRNKRSQGALELLESHSESLIRKAMIQALQGNAQILNKLLDRMLPRRLDLPIKTGPLRTSNSADLSRTADAVLQKVATGKLSLSEAQALQGLLEVRRRMLAIEDLENRLRAIENLLLDKTA